MDAGAARRVLIAASLGAPAVAAALLLIAVEAWRLVRPDSSLFGEPPPASLAEAIAGGFGVEHAYAFIRAGQDPNAPIAVNDPDYTGGRAIHVSPLMLATAARDSNAVAMLLSFGARPDLPQNRLAPCLARQLGDAAILAMIARAGADATVPCVARRQAVYPLLAWVE